MALAATLQGDFADGGFSVSGTIGELEVDYDTSGLPSAPIDASSIDDAIAGLEDSTTSELFEAVQLIVDALGEAGLEIPVLDDVIDPLSTALELGEELITSFDTGAFGGVLDAGVDISGVGIETLQQRVGAVTSALGGPEVRAGLDLLESFLPQSIDLDGTLGRLTEWFETAKVLISVVAGLMGCEGTSREMRDGVELVLSMMRPSEISGLLHRLSGWSGRNVADLLVGVDPNDAELAALIKPAVLNLTSDIRVTAEALTRGLGFGQATLVGLDLPAMETRLTAASNLLVEDGLGQVRALAEQVVDFAAPILGVTLPDPIESVDAFVTLLQDQMGSMASALENLDPNRLSAVVTSGAQPLLDVVHSIRAAAEQVVVLAASAFDALDELIDSIDLSAITDTISALLEPVQEVLDAITSVIADAEVVIGDVSDAVVAAMNTVRTATEGAAAAIADAFGRVQTVLDGINIDEIQLTIEGKLTPIADTLASARVKPFFDTANDVIDTTATIVAAVPLGLLPDDAKSDLAEAVRPLKEVDFQRDVADVLNAKMAEILEQLDTTVLSAIEEAYQDVITFLAEVDPATPLAEFEADVFDPFIAELRNLNPQDILQPLEDAIDPVREAVAGFNIDDELLAPIEDAIDEMAAGLAALSPADLIAPLQSRIDGVRAEVTTQLRLDDIDGWLDTAEETIVGWFDRIDPARLIGALDGAYANILRDIERGSNGVGLGGSVVVSMMQGAGLNLRTDSFDEVVRWIQGEVGSSIVAERLGTAASRLAELRDAVATAELADVVAGLQPEWRALNEAVLALPEGSALRVSLELEVQASDPQALLAPFVEAHASYVVALTDATASLERLAQSERGSIDAVAQAIRDALRPLSAFPIWAMSLLSRFGLDPTGKSLKDLLLELLRAFTPSQLFEPLVTALETLVANFQAAASTGLLAPARTIVGDVRAALDAIDISVITSELEEVFDALVAKLDALRPAVILGPTLGSLAALQAELVNFNPLAPVEVAVEAIKTAIEDGAENLRPTVIFAPAIEIYDTVIGLIGALNVRAMLEPLIIALEGIAADLGEGIDSMAIELKDLQDALPDPDSLASGSASASASVSISL